MMLKFYSRKKFFWRTVWARSKAVKLRRRMQLACDLGDASVFRTLAGGFECS